MKIKKIIFNSNMNDFKPKVRENVMEITSNRDRFSSGPIELFRRKILMAASNGIYIVDPKGEYSSLIKSLGGSETEIDIDK